MTNPLTRLALQLVPASWRRTVEEDLDEELRASGRRGLGATWWAIAQTLRVAFRLRPAMTGDVFMSDLRFAIRQLRRTPVFTASAILTLALGLGLTVAAFSVADGILFKPLPYGEPDRLVMIHGWDRQRSTPYSAVPQSVVDAIRSGSATLEGIGVRDQFSVPSMLAAPDGPAYRVAAVSIDALDVLRVRVVHGRNFAPGDEKASPTPVLLTTAAWTSRFGGDLSVLDRTIALPRQAIRIVGILPDGFLVPGVSSTRAFDVLFPAAPAGRAGRGVLAPFARLRPGATVTAADLEMNQVVDRTRPAARRDTGVRVSPMRFGLTELRRPAVITLFVAALLVLLVATVSVATLLLARGLSRRGELAVRVALGASRVRVARLLVSETAVVTVTGGALGILIALAAFRAIADAVPPEYRMFMTDRLDGRAIVFGLLSMIVAGLGFAVTAAIAGTRADLRAALERAGRHRAGGMVRAGRWLLAGQAMVAIALVVGAVFMVTSFHRLSRVDLGFEPAELYQAALMGPLPEEPADAMRARYETLMERLAARRDLSVAAADSLPWTGETALRGLQSAGVAVAIRGVSHAFLDVNRARLVSGRWPSADEFRTMAPVAVINRRGASAIWPGGEAIGEVLSVPQSGSFQVVGVIDDLKSRYDRPAEAEVFVPLDLNVARGTRFLVRSSLPPAMLTAALTEASRSVQPAGAAVAVTPAMDDLDAALYLPRLIAIVFTLFAAIVLLVSAVGIVGLLLYVVEHRRYEMGVRMALGASRRAVGRSIARDALQPIAIGLVIGLGLSWWATRFVESLFFEVRSYDIRLYLASAIILLSLAAIAALAPARRASRVDPLIVMRAE